MLASSECVVVTGTSQPDYMALVVSDIVSCHYLGTLGRVPTFPWLPGDIIGPSFTLY